MTASQLLNLPPELLTKVLVDVDASTLRVSRMVCKLMRDVVDGSAEIRYKLELALAGYIDGPASAKLSTVERYQRLVQHQEAWQNLTWRQADEYFIDNRSSTYELYGGVYAQGLEAKNTPDGVFRSGTRGMELIEFPSLLRNQPDGHAWIIEDLGVDVKDFGMDPDKNLLILMERVARQQHDDDNPPLQVHLLNLRDTEATPHSLAHSPILRHQPTVYKRSYSYWVQVVGDLLAILFQPGADGFGRTTLSAPAADELVIWNWRTGEHVALIRFPGIMARSFSFISNDVILVPVAINGRLPLLWLYRLTALPGSIQAVKIAQYSLPHFPSSVLAEISCRLDPSPWAPRPRDPLQKEAPEGGGDKEERTWPEHGPPPFAPKPSERLIVLAISLLVNVPETGPNGTVAMRMESRSYTVFVKAEALLDVWKTVEPETDDEMDGPPSEMIVKVPWDAWGPRYSRFLLEGTDGNCVCYVHGLRFCRLVLHPSGRVLLRVMDFNVGDKARKSDQIPEEPKVETAARRVTRTGDGRRALRSPSDEPNTWDEAGAMDPAPEDGSMLEEQLPIAETEDGSEEAIDVEDEDENEEDWVDEDEDRDLDGLMNAWRTPTNAQDAVAGFGSLRVGTKALMNYLEKRQVVDVPTYISDPDVFTSRLETSLPFRWAWKNAKETRRFSRVMIDNEHIIGLRTLESTGRLVLDVLTL